MMLTYKDLKTIEKLIDREYLELCTTFYNSDFDRQVESHKNYLKELKKTINNCNLQADISIVRQKQTESG